MSRPAGLGRGLSALLGEVQREQPLASTVGREGARMIAVADLSPHPDQPRRHFDAAALTELADSIAKRGLIQPIVARPSVAGGYQIIAGERRWRAAQQAQLHQVPVIVREFEDSEALEIALIENIQREDLNAIEEAEAYQRLGAQFGHNQETLGKLVGKSRSHIANLLRLLELPAPVRAMVADGRLQMGHARALITASDPETLAKDVVKRGLSVRETEQLAKGVRPTRRKAIETKGAETDIWSLERQLSGLLGLGVKIKHQAKSGTVTLSYASLEQLDLICQRLTGERI